MRADDRAEALSRYLEPRVYQRNRAHLCSPGPRYHPGRSGRGGKRREWALLAARRRRVAYHTARHRRPLF
jgi:hypothetical protein